MVRAVATKKAVSSPKTIARVTFWAGVTVLSRTVVTTRSMLSTASVVQSLMAPRPVREPGERTWPRPVSGASGQVEDRDRPARPCVEQHEGGAVTGGGAVLPAEGALVSGPQP